MINASLYYYITDPRKCIYRVNDYENAIKNLGISAIRSFGA